MQYVSLNVRGIRKVLNKLDRGTSDSPQKPKDGCMALEVERPHHPGSTTFQVAFRQPHAFIAFDTLYELTLDVGLCLCLYNGEGQGEGWLACLAGCLLQQGMSVPKHRLDCCSWLNSSRYCCYSID